MTAPLDPTAVPSGVLAKAVGALTTTLALAPPDPGFPEILQGARTMYPTRFHIDVEGEQMTVTNSQRYRVQSAQLLEPMAAADTTVVLTHGWGLQPGDQLRDGRYDVELMTVTAVDPGPRYGGPCTVTVTRGDDPRDLDAGASLDFVPTDPARFLYRVLTVARDPDVATPHPVGAVATVALQLDDLLSWFQPRAELQAAPRVSLVLSAPGVAESSWYQTTPAYTVAQLLATGGEVRTPAGFTLAIAAGDEMEFLVADYSYDALIDQSGAAGPPDHAPLMATVRCRRFLDETGAVLDPDDPAELWTASRTTPNTTQPLTFDTHSADTTTFTSRSATVPVTDCAGPTFIKGGTYRCELTLSWDMTGFGAQPHPGLIFDPNAAVS